MFDHRPRIRRLARAAGLMIGLVVVIGCASSVPSPSSLAAASGSPAQAVTSIRPTTSAAAPASNAAAPWGSAAPVASGGGFRPTVSGVPCPDDVTFDVVLQISCGYLTVLEDRAKPDGRTIQLFVIRVEPPGGTTTLDPIIGISGLAKQDEYGGMVGVGQRTHRVAYLFDPRGIGHSKPALDCPEVAAVGPALAGLRLRDPAHRTMELEAVRACHDRLVGQGIDLAAYDLKATAEDVEDFRIALGIVSWNLMAYGDGSRIAFEIARRFPAGLRSVFVDSMTLPTPDLLTVGPESFDLAISQLVAACSAQPACATAYPHFDTMIQEATARLDAKPVVIDVKDTVATRVAGHPIRVVVDGDALLRWIRASLATDGGKGAGDVPRTLRAALDDKIAVTDPIVVALAADTGDCLGLVPNCDGISFGALDSIVCRDMATQIDESRLMASVDGRPAYADIFAPSPLLAPCAVWSVGASDPDPSSAGSLTNGVPTVVMRGTLDPFSALPADLKGAASDATSTYFVEVPNQSNNAIGFYECPRAIRDAWVDAPAAPPADMSCLAGIPPIPLGP